MSLIAERPEAGPARDYHFPAVVRRPVAGGEVVAAHLPGHRLAVAVLILPDRGRAGAGRRPGAWRRCWPRRWRRGLSAVTRRPSRSPWKGSAPRSSPRLTGTASRRVCRSPPSGCCPPSNCSPRRSARRGWTRPTWRGCVTTRRTGCGWTGRTPAPAPTPPCGRTSSARSCGSAGPCTADPASVAALSVDEVIAFHRQWFGRPGTLVVVGDLDRLDLDALGAAAFAGATEGGPLLEGPLEITLHGGRRILLVDRPGSVQSTLRLGHPAPPRTHPDYVPMMLAATVLGGAFTSRLNHLIREVRGYTYGIRSDFGLSRRFGRFLVSSAVQTAVTAPALVDAVGEIERTRTDGVTEPELAVARSWRAGQTLGGAAEPTGHRRRPDHAGGATGSPTTTTRSCGSSCSPRARRRSRRRRPGTCARRRSPWSSRVTPRRSGRS